MKQEIESYLDVPGNGYTLTTLTGEGAFHLLKGEWNDLWRQSSDATHFQCWDWQYIYYKHLIPLALPKIIIARDTKGRCAAIAAFCTVIDSASGLSKAAFLGDKSPDYNMILCRPDVPFNVGFQMFDWFFNNANWHASFLELSNIPHDSWTNAVLFAYLRCNTLPSDLLVQWTTETNAITLPGDIKTYLNKLGTRSRRDFAYDRRRLEKDFPVEWRIFDKNADLEQCLVAVETIDRARWNQDSQYCDPVRRAFLLSLAQAQSNAGMYLAFVLYLNGRPASYVTGSVVRNSYELDSIGYDPNIAPRLSIGKAMNFYAIGECIRRRFSKYDLTRGSEAYKGFLGAQSHSNMHIRLYRSQIDRSLVVVGEKILAFLRQQTWLRRFYQRSLRRSSLCRL